MLIIENDLFFIYCTKAGNSCPREIPRQFAKSHIDAVMELGYPIGEEEQKAMAEALERFYICDIGPAPFSVHALLEHEEDIDNELTVTVSEHCLQMATHWLRHPPAFFSVRELEELIVLTLFHDVWYYDDFCHHGKKTVDLLTPWVRYSAHCTVLYLSLKI